MAFKSGYCSQNLCCRRVSWARQDWCPFSFICSNNKLCQLAQKDSLPVGNLLLMCLWAVGELIKLAGKPINTDRCK